MKLIQIALLNSFSSLCLGFTSTNYRSFPFGLHLSQQPPDWESYSYGNDTGNKQNQQPEQINALENEANIQNNDEEALKGNRWSQFAPNANLPTEEFRAQLKENMKVDLERRRKADPNRGNQPAKSYLDSL